MIFKRQPQMHPVPVFLAGYPLLREAMSSLPDTSSVDLSGILDERTPEEEFYLDFCHVNHAANRRIAAAIGERLRALPGIQSAR